MVARPTPPYVHRPVLFRNELHHPDNPPSHLQTSTSRISRRQRVVFRVRGGESSHGATRLSRFSAYLPHDFL